MTLSLFLHNAIGQIRKVNVQKKREPNPYPPSGPLGRPHRNDKSKAHAVRHEHFAYYSISVFALKKFPRFLRARTIAECYLINMLFFFYFRDAMHDVCTFIQFLIDNMFVYYSFNLFGFCLVSKIATIYTRFLL
jgi:hypothetical protein